MPEHVTIAKERKALMKLMDQGDFKIPKREVDENIIIATWNIQHFGPGTPPERCDTPRTSSSGSTSSRFRKSRPA